MRSHGRTALQPVSEKLGVAKNILTTRLRTLVAQGILELKPASDGSAYQDYAPRQTKREAVPILVALRQWGEQYAFFTPESHIQCSGGSQR
jgi:DNA-binding HxlR family transcriptional regulator